MNHPILVILYGVVYTYLGSWCKVLCAAMFEEHFYAMGAQ